MYFMNLPEYSLPLDLMVSRIRDILGLRKRNFHRGRIMILLSALILGQINWKCPAIS